MDRIDLRGAQIHIDTALTKITAADAALGDVVRKMVRFDDPAGAAFVIMATAIENAGRGWPPAVSEVVRALLGYQRGLDFAAGWAAAAKEMGS